MPRALQRQKQGGGWERSGLIPKAREQGKTLSGAGRGTKDHRDAGWLQAREGEGSWRGKSETRLTPRSSAKQIDKLEEQRAFLSARTEREPTSPRQLDRTVAGGGKPVLPSRGLHRCPAKPLTHPRPSHTGSRGLPEQHGMQQGLPCSRASCSRQPLAPGVAGRGLCTRGR